MKRSFILLGLLTLLLGSGVLIWSAFKPYPEPTLHPGDLAKLLPTGEEYGWHHEDLPLGPTEAIAEASQRTLNLTDFVYRRYKKGPDTFEVYVAYWEPGRMPARKMNEHTPDTCWVSSGWEIIEKQDNYVISFDAPTSLSDSQNSTNSALQNSNTPKLLKTTPGRWRRFEKGNHRINVVFWHLLDGEPYQYGHQTLRKRLYQLTLDPFRLHFDIRREQFLIRISSTNNIDSPQTNNFLEVILISLSAHL